MKYFNSVNFSELILKNNYEDSHKSLIKIFKYLTFCKKKSLSKFYSKNIFERKILELEKIYLLKINLFLKFLIY